METRYKIFHGDCTDGAKKHLTDESVDLMVCDPPFGIGEVSFGKHYKRDGDHIIEGYKEAPDDYYQFTLDWMREAVRVLKANGSMYIIAGHTPLSDVLLAASELNLHVVNHIIWKYNFGVFTTRKFVTSHYHILYFTKKKSVRPTFNTNCRFGSQEKDSSGGSLLYQDMEDVWIIKKEFQMGTKKNSNKLPDALLEKIILYSSNQGDTVCDFFLGNFTTAKVAHGLGRIPYGFEYNEEAHVEGIKIIESREFGGRLSELKVVEDIKPANQGKPIDTETRAGICNDFIDLTRVRKYTKKDAILTICEKYGRGRFSIINIVDTIPKESP